MLTHCIWNRLKSENSYEMGFQTKHEDNGEQVNKEIEHDAEWAKLQVGVAEAEYKKLSLEAERIESNLEQSESDLLDFLREISADL